MYDVLNLMIELKRAYEKDNILSYESEPFLNKTCIDKWLSKLNDEHFNRIFSGINKYQYKNFITVKYNKFFNALDENGNNVDYEDFFNLYNKLYRSCRGLTIDIVNEKIVLASYDKFFNLNEIDETKEPIIKERLKNAVNVDITDKLDGSLVSAAFYEYADLENNIVVSGSSCSIPEISVIVENSYKYINSHENYVKLLKENPNKTFMFEHIFPMIDPHVVIYNKEGLFLTGMKNNITGKESNYKDIKEIAKKYDILITDAIDTTLDVFLTTLDDKKFNEAEGVVLNMDGYKVKIKYNDFVAMHKIVKIGQSYNSVIKLMDDENLDDILSKINPQIKELIEKTMDEINVLINKIDTFQKEYYQSIKDLDKKTAMIKIQNELPKNHQSYMINRYLGRNINYFKTKVGKSKTYNELLELAENTKLNY